MEQVHRLANILNSFSHPGNVFVLTDIQSAGNLAEDNFQLFSYVLIAVIIIRTSNTSALMDLNQFQSSEIIRTLQYSRGSSDSKPFFIVDLPPKLGVALANQMHKSFVQIGDSISGSQSGTALELKQPRSIDCWQPSFLITWTKSVHTELKRHEIQTTGFLTSLEELFVNVPLRLDSNIFLLIFESLIVTNENMVEVVAELLTVFEAYQVKQRRIFSVVASFVWPTSTRDELENIALENHGRRRSNFFEEKFTGVVKDTEATNNDWGNVRQREDGTYFLADGYVANLYRDLKIVMNFTEYILVGDAPRVDKTGMLVGKTVDLLRSEEGDFSLSKMSLHPERAKALSFLTPTHQSLAYVFFKQPSPNSFRNVVTAPLNINLWLTLLAFWLILLIFLEARRFIVPTLCNDLENPDAKIIFEIDYPFLREGWIWCIAVACQKSFYINPISVSLKIKVIIGLLVSVISYTAYSASFVSSLAVSNIPVKQFWDLTSSNFVFTVHEDSQPFHNFLRALINTYGLHQKLKTVSTVKEVSQLFTVSGSNWRNSIGDESVHSTKKAFLSYADMFFKTAQSHNYSNSFVCNHISFFRLPIGRYLSKSAMLVKKGSQFKEVLNYALNHLRGFGLIYRNDNTYNKDNILQCLTDDSYTKAQPSDFADVSGILITLSLGTLISILVLAFEFGIYRGFCSHNPD